MKRTVSSFRPYLVIICGLGILLLCTSLPGIAYYNKTLQEKTKPQNQQQESATGQTEKVVKNQESTNPTTSAGDPDSKFSESSISEKPATTIPSSPTATNTSEVQVSQNLKVMLSINSVSKGTISMTAGSNQCQVLGQALQQGFIQSLDMRYSEQYKTMAVYVINGLGESNEIWWTYSVNGKPPPFGCSKMTVRNGDQVNWWYVK